MAIMNPTWSVREPAAEYRCYSWMEREPEDLPFARRDSLTDCTSRSAAHVSRASSSDIGSVLDDTESDPPMFGWSTVDTATNPYLEALGQIYHRFGQHASYTVGGHRYLSPSNSSLWHVSSGGSDRQATPLRALEVEIPYLPELVVGEITPYALGGYNERPAGVDHSCVAMHDVQQYEDAQPEPVVYDEDMQGFGNQPQEGYQPLEHESIHSEVLTQGYEDSHHNAPTVNVIKSSFQPNVKRRRIYPIKPTTSPIVEGKVGKRPIPRRTSAQNTKKYSIPPNPSKPSKYDTSRAFICPLAPYGCTSTFTSKNEWKRHINTQHLRLGFWRCGYCHNDTNSTTIKTNDFNRKDLFIQHLRRMHPDTIPKSEDHTPSLNDGKRRNNDRTLTDALATESQNSYHALREPPGKSGCLFCARAFEGAGSWEARMEHVAGHMGVGGKGEGERSVGVVDGWRRDAGFEAWAVGEGVLGEMRGGLRLLL